MVKLYSIEIRANTEYNITAGRLYLSTVRTVGATVGTPTEIVALRSYVDSVVITEHNNLNSIQGGISGERYHLSLADVNKLTGIAANANNYIHPNHTGDVTSAGDGATTIANLAVTTGKIANQAVTYAKFQNVGTSTIVGRTAAGTGSTTALSVSQVRSMLSVQVAQQKSITLKAPEVGDTTTLYIAGGAMTVTNTQAVIVGESGSSVTYQVTKTFARDVAGTTLYTTAPVVTSQGSPQAFIPNDSSISGGNIVLLQIIAVTGLVDELHVSVNYAA
jgi:hypothetical protein